MQKIGARKEDCQLGRRVNSKPNTSNFQGNIVKADARSTTSKDEDALTVLYRSEIIYHQILNSKGSFHMTP